MLLLVLRVQLIPQIGILSVIYPFLLYNLGFCRFLSYSFKVFYFPKQFQPTQLLSKRKPFHVFSLKQQGSLKVTVLQYLFLRLEDQNFRQCSLFMPHGFMQQLCFLLYSLIFSWCLIWLVGWSFILSLLITEVKFSWNYLSYYSGVRFGC